MKFTRKKLRVPANKDMFCNLGDSPGTLNIWDGTNKCIAAKNVERGNIKETWNSYRKKIINRLSS